MMSTRYGEEDDDVVELESDEEIEQVVVLEDPREEIREEEEREFTPHDMIKRLFAEMFDVDEVVLNEFQERKGVQISVGQFPTRRETRGYSWIPSADDRKSVLPKQLREVSCPLCSGLMTPLKSKANTKFGETITYQCHQLSSVNREPCLMMMSLTLSCPYFLRPGDFTKSDYDWRDIAEETVYVPPGAAVMDRRIAEIVVRPIEIPPSPYGRNVLSNVMWQAFWKRIVEEGECVVSDLYNDIVKKRPRDGKPGKGRDRVDSYIDQIPGWMTKFTGYVVKLQGQVFRVVGRTRGDVERFPFRDEDYRRKHGFIEY